MSDEVQPLHLRSEGFWTDNAPDVPASEWYARCTAGVLHDPQGESIVCMCGLDTKERPDGLKESDGLAVGHLPRVEGPPRLPAWGVHPTVAAEQPVDEVDGVRFDLAAHDALGVDRDAAISSDAHGVGTAPDADAAVRVDDTGDVGEIESVHNAPLTGGGEVTPFYKDEWLTVLHGDAREMMRSLPAESVHCVVSSPPYWGLRDYGTATWDGGDAECDHLAGPLTSSKSGLAGYTSENIKLRTNGMPQKAVCRKCGARRIDAQLGLEPTPEAYVANMVAVFREVRRVLRADGTVWLNLGDSYNAYNGNAGPSSTIDQSRSEQRPRLESGHGLRTRGLKPKDLVGIPWRVAFALQADGWYLRSDIIWAKPNPMPESVTDRPTKSHEYIFLLSKSPRYYFDADAVREEQRPESLARYRHPFMNGAKESSGAGRPGAASNTPGMKEPPEGGRNIRSVWTIATAPYPGAHFATFPPKLVEPCVKAGCPEGGVVLDPFAGSGTTGMVAQALGRRAVLIDLSMDYLGQLMERNAQKPLGLGAA